MSDNPLLAFAWYNSQSIEREADFIQAAVTRLALHASHAHDADSAIECAEQQLSGALKILRAAKGNKKRDRITEGVSA